MAELVTRLTVELDTEELDRAIERYALVSRADVREMIAEAINKYNMAQERARMVR